MGETPSQKDPNNDPISPPQEDPRGSPPSPIPNKTVSSNLLSPTLWSGGGGGEKGRGVGLVTW